MENLPGQPSSPKAAASLRGEAAKAYEQGIIQRVTVTEFDSVAQAVAAHNGPGYQEALKALGNACERDVRIVGGVD
jgi:uncharacterized protein (DUF1330 family)